MNVVANVLVAVVAAFHGYVLILEMFLWQGPRGRALHGLDPDGARTTAPLAANQGLYNGFLAAGLVWGLAAGDPVGFQAKVFFLQLCGPRRGVRRRHRLAQDPLSCSSPPPYWRWPRCSSRDDRGMTAGRPGGPEASGRVGDRSAADGTAVGGGRPGG